MYVGVQVRRFGVRGCTGATSAGLAAHLRAQAISDSITFRLIYVDSHGPIRTLGPARRGSSQFSRPECTAARREAHASPRCLHPTSSCCSRADSCAADNTASMACARSGVGRAEVSGRVRSRVRPLLASEAGPRAQLADGHRLGIRIRLPVRVPLFLAAEAVAGEEGSLSLCVFRPPLLGVDGDAFLDVLDRLRGRAREHAAPRRATGAPGGIRRLQTRRTR